MAGWLVFTSLLVLGLALAAALVYSIYQALHAGRIIGIVFLVLGLAFDIFLFAGLFMLQPNEAAVMLLFGRYKGTVRGERLLWANPLYQKIKVSLRARTINGEKLKVNDQRGNPIEIAAVVAARTRIVEGAVGMVEMALEQLEKHKTINLDEERKAAMVSNLLVVLCGEQGAQAVVNTGSLYT